MRIKARIKGLKRLADKFDDLGENVKTGVEDVLERNALRMVNETKVNAPRDTGALVNSIDIIPKYNTPLQRVYGTNLIYARKQEYEHPTKKGFFRKAYLKNRPHLVKDIDEFVERQIGKEF